MTTPEHPAPDLRQAAVQQADSVHLAAPSGQVASPAPRLTPRASESHELPRTPSGWQPIATAPKDGRGLLLGHFNSHGKWRTVRGEWCSEAAIAESWEDPEAPEGWYETSVESDDVPNCWWTEPTHWMPLPAAPDAAPPAQEQAGQMPAHRGYVLFGAGAYLLTICKGDERGPELVAHLATEDEKVGRVVGDLGDVVPDKEIPLERVAVRLQFASEAGLAALEQQLRMLREEYFPAASPVQQEVAAPKGEVRNVTAREDRFLRAAVLRSSTLVHGGKLVIPARADAPIGFHDPERIKAWDAAGKRIHDEDEGIAAPAGQPAEGYKLVPLEPTTEMKLAGQQYASDTADRPKGLWWWGRLFQAMLAAAPSVGQPATSSEAAPAPVVPTSPNECPTCGLEEWDYVYEPGRVSPSYKHCCRCDTKWSAQ